MKRFVKIVVWICIVAILIVGGWAGWKRRQKAKEGKTAEERIFAKVEEGPLVINLVESGSIKPREQIVIKSQMEGRVSILYIVPEGQRVKKGDVLVELDASTQKDNLVNQEITVQNAEASLVEAQ